MSSPAQHSNVALLGLGPMGAALARSVAAVGHHLAVWNRTPRTPNDIGLAGDSNVVVASSPTEAVEAAEIVVICVRDHTASRAIVEQIATAATTAIVVNLSTGTPAEAVESAERAQALGLRYITGAVMVPTPMVGTADCFVLYAGAPDDIRAADPMLTALGGTADVVGDDHAVPPALDLAMLDVYFAGMYAFLHSAALAAAHGIDAARYLPYAEGIVDTLRGTLPGLTAALQRRTYDGGEARLDMCLAFLEHIVATSAEAGIRPGPTGVVRDASAQAMQRWPGSTDWDVVAEDLGIGDPVAAKQHP